MSSTNSTNPIQCRTCRKPIFTMSLIAGQSSEGWLSLKNQTSFVRDGSIFVRGRCGTCNSLMTLQDPQGPISADIDRSEQELGVRGGKVVEVVKVVEVRTVRVATLAVAGVG